MTRLHLRADAGITITASLAAALGGSARDERWLFLQAHDDDANVGVGMTIALAGAEGFAVHIGIVTNGCMGYCDLEDQPRIVEIRQAEAVAAYRFLGVKRENLHFLGFDDGRTYQYLGRRPAAAGDPEVAGHTGLENHLTQLIRLVAPQRIFTPASTDIHPDHQAVHKEVLISIYHAAGEIWPELGRPCALPEIYEYPTYVEMAKPPDVMLEGAEELFQKKLDSLACYVSQRQFGAVVRRIKEAGPLEFFRNIRFALYQPSVYKPLFVQPDGQKPKKD